jgi:hypothetical protein
VRNASNVIIRNNHIISQAEHPPRDEQGGPLSSSPIDLDAVSQSFVNDNIFELCPVLAAEPIKVGTEVDQVTVTNNRVKSIVPALRFAIQ